MRTVAMVTEVLMATIIMATETLTRTCMEWVTDIIPIRCMEWAWVMDMGWDTAWATR